VAESLRAVMLLVLMIAGAALRWEGIHREPLWLDEIYSLELTVARGYRHTTLPMGVILTNPPKLTTLANAAPWWQIWPQQRTDAHPPLYFILLRWWREIFGESATVARMFSLVSSLLAIPLMYWIGRELYRPAVGLWCAALMALSPLQIIFARETRPYAIATTLALATAAAAVVIYRHGWTLKRAVALTFALLAMMLTHYLTAGVALGLLAWLMIALPGKDRWRTLATFAIAGAIYCLIWGPILIQQLRFTGRNLDWLREPGPHHALTTLWRTLPMPLRLIAPVMGNSERVAPLAAVIVALPLLLLRRNRQLLLGLLWTLGTLGLIAALDIARTTAELNQIRYPLIAAPGIYLLLAGMLAHMRGRWWQIAPAAGVIYCLVSLPSLYDKTKEDWRELARWIGRDGGDNAIAVLASTDRTWDWESAPSTLYLGASYYETAHGMHYVLIDKLASPELIAKLRTYRIVYLVNGWPKDGADVVLPGMTPMDSLRVDRIGKLFKMNPK
jgi:hypothetical protein